MKDFLHLFPKNIQENITASWDISKKEAKYEPFPDQISEKIKGIFISLGITQLYKHQAESIRFTYLGKNVTIVTGTSSGKSLCYQIPVLDSIVGNNKNTSLMLFPTKALSVDQFINFQKIL
ncbi:MAG: DEAD/DEAH box helicase, partial [Candidatus Lokiarchaeota archaeon]|nr:DEAD/DEAH box helicase [Candidatus Lokiarchaeota archaeon]